MGRQSVPSRTATASVRSRRCSRPTGRVRRDQRPAPARPTRPQSHAERSRDEFPDAAGPGSETDSAAGLGLTRHLARPGCSPGRWGADSRYSQRRRLLGNVAAADVRLTTADLTRLAAAIPRAGWAGDRYFCPAPPRSAARDDHVDIHSNGSALVTIRLHSCRQAVLSSGDHTIRVQRKARHAAGCNLIPEFDLWNPVTAGCGVAVALRTMEHLPWRNSAGRRVRTAVVPGPRDHRIVGGA